MGRITLDRRVRRAHRRLAALPDRVRKAAADVRETLFDAAADADLDGLPNKDLLVEVREVLSVASATIAERLGGIDVALSEADRKLADVRARWDERKRPVEERYEAMLRDLQRSKVDGNEYMRTQKKIEQVAPCRGGARTAPGPSRQAPRAAARTPARLG